MDVLIAIAHIGVSHRRDVVFAEDLSPILENALAADERAHDINSAAAVAAALLNIGAQSGVAAVGRFAAERRAGVMEIDRRLGDVGRVRNPDAIPALARLLASPADKGVLEFAGGNLVGIGTAQSMLPVLQWLGEAPDNAVPIVNLWFASLSREARDATRHALRDRTFRSAAVKAALAERLEANTPVVVYDSKSARD
jgi:hypothetical protein